MNTVPVCHESVWQSLGVQEPIQLYVLAGIILQTLMDTNARQQPPTQSIKRVLILTSSNADYLDAS